MIGANLDDSGRRSDHLERDHSPPELLPWVSRGHGSWVQLALNFDVSRETLRPFVSPFVVFSRCFASVIHAIFVAITSRWSSSESREYSGLVEVPGVSTRLVHVIWIGLAQRESHIGVESCTARWRVSLLRWASERPLRRTWPVFRSPRAEELKATGRYLRMK